MSQLNREVGKVVESADSANLGQNVTTDVAYTDDTTMYPIDHLHDLQPLEKSEVPDETTTFPTTEGGLTGTAAVVVTLGFLALVAVLVIYGQPQPQRGFYWRPGQGGGFNWAF